MTKKVRSMRGEIVDFDMMKIKESLATHVPPQQVEQRQTYVDQSLRRRIRQNKKATEVVDPPVEYIEPADEAASTEESAVESKESTPTQTRPRKTSQKARKQVSSTTDETTSDEKTSSSE